MSDDRENDFDTPRFRSGAAARMARIPPSTLRIWERRHRIVGPHRSASGQRLYSRRDVQRLIMIKRLCDRGYAIGTVAAMDYGALEQLARGDAFGGENSPLPPMSVVAVGPGWSRPVAARSDDRLWHEYATIDAARAARLPSPVEALIARVGSLQEAVALDLLAIAGACGARRIAVAYSFASTAAIARLQEKDVHLRREIGPPGSTADFLAGDGAADRESKPPSPQLPWVRARRRFTDRQLAIAAQASSLITCECPRHISDIIGQLSAFEDYCDNCVSRDAADALLHRHLGDVTNHARQLFESALARLVEIEGLPVSTPSSSAAKDDPSAGRGDP